MHPLSVVIGGDAVDLLIFVVVLLVIVVIILKILDRI